MRNWGLYVLLLPTLLYAAIFLYWPMYGILIAFKDYKAPLGILGSPWTDQHGLKYFLQFFSSYSFEEIVGNTLRISVYYLLVSTPIPIAFALLLNYIERPGFKKVVQTVTYAPHFISIMILCGMLRIFLSPYGGLINVIAQALGAPEAVNYIDSASAFRTIYISSSIWQDAGWGTIIYLATLSSVDASLHEAAKVDGASTWQRILHIDIPELVPIIVIQLIMQFGNLMNVGFEKAFLLQTNLNKETSEIIATYVYEQGMLKAMYSFSTAVGLFNTAVNIILLIAVNKICKKLSDVSFI